MPPAACSVNPTTKRWLTVIVETPERIAGQSEYSTLQALGPEVSACSTVYYWPQEKRRSHGEKYRMRPNLVLPLAGLLLLACIGFYATSDGKTPAVVEGARSHVSPNRM
jgi:hypothetical protein